MAAFHNKLNELEARLKAENEARRRDNFQRELSFEGPNYSRVRPYERGPPNGRSSSPGVLSLNIPSRRNYVRGSPSPNSANAYNHPPLNYPDRTQFGEAQEISGDEFNKSNIGHVQQQVQYFNQQQYPSGATPPPSNVFSQSHHSGRATPPSNLFSQQQQGQQYGRATPPSNLFGQRPPPSSSPHAGSQYRGGGATPPMSHASTYSPSPSPGRSSPYMAASPSPGRATPPSNLFGQQKRGAPPPSSLFGGGPAAPPQDTHMNDHSQDATTPTNTSPGSALGYQPPPEAINGDGGGMGGNGSRSNLHINLPSPAAFAISRPRRVASPGSLSLPFQSPASGRPASPGSISLPGMTPCLTTPSPGAFAHSPLSLNIPRQGSEGSPASSPGSLSLPGSLQRRRRDFNQPWSPASSQPRQIDSAEIDRKYHEIMQNSGILTINGVKYKTDMSDLEPLGELGRGTCGHVVKMRHKQTGQLMAVKQMHRSRNREESKRIIMDLDVVVKCHNCKYIVQSIGTFITPGDVWICMELMSTCLEKLQRRLKQPIPERILGKVAVATVRALHYLKEEHGVIHRDIKPSNILLDEKGQIKLCDFGISGRLVDSKAKTRSAGCAAYMAPERIDPPDPTKPDYDIRADVWSLGISLVELAIGQFPYRNCKTDFEVLTKVLTEDPPVLPAGAGFSMDFCSFVFQCLVKDYRKRPKYKKLLEHNFIKRYSTANVNVGQWFQDVTAQMEPWTPSPISPGFLGGGFIPAT